MANRHRRGLSGRGVAGLTPAERRRVLEEWNDTGAGDTGGDVAGVVRGAGGAGPRTLPRVVYGGVAMSYAELNARANRLARYLVSLGAGPERLVAVAMPRSAGMIVAVLAVLRPGRRTCRSTRRIRRTGSRSCSVMPARSAVLTTMAAGGDLPGGMPRVAVDDGDRGSGVAAGWVIWLAASGLLVLGPSSPAYVIYTSGSTGRPKGVVVEHRSVVRLLRWARAEFPRAELARVLASTSLSFDVSVLEMFAPLVCGGRAGGREQCAHAGGRVG